MSGIVERLKPAGILAGRWIGSLMAGVILLGWDPVEASPIVRRDWSTGAAPQFREWARYLLAGPSAWAEVVHPAVTPAVRSAIWKSLATDPDSADPMVRFLLWKQAIDPPRFAHYHPRLAPILTRISKVPSAPQQLVPTAPIPPPVLTESNPYPPPVSEPGTLLLAIGMAGWALWRGRRGRAAT
jgi:hypothetical protein